MFKNSIELNPAVILVLCILMALALITSNPAFTILALSFPPIAAKLLWKKNEPPVLFLGMMFQWMQVSIKVFYADIFDVSFKSVSDYPENIEAAFILCLTALLVESIGIFLIIKQFTCPPITHLKKLSDLYSLNKITLFYIAFSATAPIALAYGPSSILQFIYKLVDFKWAIFFIFYSLTFLKQTKAYNFYFVISVEIILGFTGYFSSFKDFFLFAAICYLTIKQRLSAFQYVFLGISAVLLFNVMVIWQSVKGDYRNYLSGGVAAQIVTVSRTQALNVLSYRVSTLNKDDYRRGMRALVDRISYIGFFSAAKSYVPSKLPHENGRLWFDAITKLFTPRILFPNKPVIDDSEKTRKYTGLSFAGAEQGTSISLGYVTESYIDFGPVLMFVPLFLFGIVIGWVYSFIVTKSYNQLLGYACTIPLFFQLYTFELALDKEVGALIAYFIVYLIVRRFAMPSFEGFISNPQTPRFTKHEYPARQRLV
jgi:hypothetical protein